MSEFDVAFVANLVVQAIHANALRARLDVGAILLREIYGDSVEAYEKRGPKDDSISKVAQQKEVADVGWSKHTLYEALDIYLLSEREDLSEFPHLTTTHLRIIANQPRENQQALLRKAESERLTTRQLEEHLGISHAPTTQPIKAHALEAVHQVLRTLARQADEGHGLVTDLRGAGVGEELVSPIAVAMEELRDAVQAAHDQLSPKPKSPKSSTTEAGGTPG